MLGATTRHISRFIFFRRPCQRIFRLRLFTARSAIGGFAMPADEMAPESDGAVMMPRTIEHAALMRCQESAADAGEACR